MRCCECEFMFLCEENKTSSTGFERCEKRDLLLYQKYSLKDREKVKTNADRIQAMSNEEKELTAQLRQMSVQTGSLVCLGCGYEHNCGIHGCALLRQAVETIERQAVALEDLRDHDCKGNIKLVNAKVSPDGNILADEIIAGCIPNDVIVKLSEYESAQDQSGLVEE